MERNYGKELVDSFEKAGTPVEERIKILAERYNEAMKMLHLTKPFKIVQNILEAQMEEMIRKESEKEVPIKAWQMQPVKQSATWKLSDFQIRLNPNSFDQKEFLGEKL